MSSVYPPYGGPPARRCLRCGMPLSPDVVTCTNCGTHNPVGNSPQQGQVPWRGSSPQMPPAGDQYPGQQCGPSSAPPSQWAQPHPSGPPQSISAPNNFFGQPGQNQRYYGAPQQPAFYSPPPATYDGFQRSNPNGYSPTGYTQPPERERRPKLGLMLFIIGLLVIVIAGGASAGYIFLKNQGQNSNTTTVRTRITTPSVKPLFGDAFNNNQNGWDLSSTPGKFSVKIGGGSMVLEDDQQKLFMEVVPGNNLVDFRLDVDASLSKGDPSNGYGVFIRGALGSDGNLDTYYRFELYGDGTYAIFKGSLDASGKLLSSKVHDYTASSAILKGGQVNHITIIAKGSSMTFMVNQQTLYTYVDNNYKSGAVALFVSNLPTLVAGAQATFSHLAIFPAT